MISVVRRQRQADLGKFKANWVYILNSKPTGLHRLNRERKEGRKERDGHTHTHMKGREREKEKELMHCK